MKFAVSQTLFACLATEPEGDGNDSVDPRLPVLPVGEYPPNDWMMADHDSDGWPQHGRDAAIRKWRKGFAMHLSGDQHIGTTSHYGLEGFRDGVYAVCTPAISNIFPRRWFPAHPGKNPLPDRRNTGDYEDRFGNHMTVLAAACPHQYPGSGLEGLRNRATGYSILHCNRETREIQVAVWPRWVDPSEAGRPYEGWPITVKQQDNGLYGAEWELERIETPGRRDQVIQVQREPDGEVVYTLRIQGESFTPRVREPGTYTVIAFTPDGKVLAAGDDSGQVRLWDVADPARPRALPTLDGTKGKILGMSISHDGRLLAAATTDGKVLLYDIADPARSRLLATLGGFSSYAYDTAFTTHDRTLVAGSADGSLRLWTLADPSRPVLRSRILSGLTGNIYQIALSPDGRTLAVSTTEHQVGLWDITDPARPKALATLDTGKGAIFAVTFDPHGPTLAATGDQQTLYFWDYSVANAAKLVCADTGDGITRAEWTEYVQGAPYDPPCTG